VGQNRSLFFPLQPESIAFMNFRRLSIVWCMSLKLVVGLGLTGVATAQTNLVADAFNPNVAGEVLVMAEQSDGKILIGGSITRVGGVARRYLARLNVDGSLDSGFKPEINGLVRALAVQADGRVIVGGDFSRVNGTTRPFVARLNPGGTLDTGFAPALEDSCRAVVIQPNARIVVGGLGYLRRYTEAGAVDNTFTAPDVLSRRIYALALQADGKILVGGNIEVPRRGLMRLQPSGSLDAEFVSELDAPVRVVKVLPDDKIMVGGDFANSNNIPTPFVSRLASNGFRDGGFSPLLGSEGIGATEDGFPGAVRDIQLLEDGGYLVVGDVAFLGAGGATRQRMAKYSSSGSLVLSVNPAPNGIINQTVMRADGRVVVGGDFSSVGGKVRSRVARLVAPVVVSEASFAEATATVGEADGSVTLTVSLTEALQVPFTVPITFAGTARAGQDYVRPASPLRFEAGEVSKLIVIPIINDDLIEVDETIVVNLGAPNDPVVGLGAVKQAVVTIVSDDIAPEITLDPVSQIVAVGQVVDLVAEATGVPDPRLQWLKNNRNVAGATSAGLTFPAVTLADAGAYAMRATVGVTSVVTAVAQLTVVDQQPTQVVGATTANATLRARVGTRDAVTYLWHRNGEPMSNNPPLISGVTTPNLTLRNLTLGDAASYHCQVTSGVGSLDAGAVALVVYDAPPEMNVAVPPLVLPTVMVSEDYTFAPPINLDPTKTPTRFVIRGLPRGLSYDRTTGLIRGRPLVAGVYDRIVITPSNAKGAGASVTATLEVVDLPPGTEGSYVGLIGKEAVVNGNLGGVLNLRVAKTGVVTGSVRAGAEVRAFRAVLDTLAAGGDPTVTVAVRRLGGRPSFQLALTLVPADNDLVGNLGVAGAVEVAAIEGHACLPAGAAYLGLHTVTLELADSSDEGVEGIPQGNGFLSLPVTARGTLRAVGRTADGAPVTSVSHLGPAGEVLVFALQHRNTGSLHGPMTIAANATHTVAGDLKWEKGVQANLRERNYQLGFGPLNVGAVGGLYERPTDASLPVMGLPLVADNARLTFTQGGVDTAVVSPNITFTLTNRAAGSFPSFASGNNPNRVALTVNRNTGTFSGRFILVNPLPTGRNLSRTVTYQGVIAFDGTELTGGGYFLLPKLPANAEELPSRTAILSGAVLLSAP